MWENLQESISKHSTFHTGHNSISEQIAAHHNQYCNKWSTHANVYCASPPVRFGISALSSAIPKAAKQFNIQANTIERINGVPIVPAPCPSESRQLVATITPTPSLQHWADQVFSFLPWQSSSNATHLYLLHLFVHG